MPTPVSATETPSAETPADRRGHWPAVGQAAGTPSPQGLPVVAGLLLAALVAAIYWRLGGDLVRVWNLDPNYSHGFIVPLVSLAFAWLAWQQVGWPLRPTARGSDIVVGMAEIAFGFILHLVAWFLLNLLLDVVSLICVLRGLLLVVGGREVNRAYGFSVLFLFFMAPWPIAWYQPVAIQMQQLVSNVSTQMLELIGVPAYREGYLIHLPNYTMEVGQACSGLRQLTAILALAVAIGHLGNRRSWFRWTLGLLSIPIAMAANCVRVMLTGVISMLFGREWAEGVFHTLEGLAIVAMAAVMVLAAVWALTRLEQAVYGSGDLRSGRVTRSGDRATTGNGGGQGETAPR